MDSPEESEESSLDSDYDSDSNNDLEFNKSDNSDSDEIPYKKYDKKEVKFRLPSTTMICGAQSCGKTTFLLLCLKHVKHLFDPLPAQIVYCYSQYNDSIKILQKMGVTIHQGIPSDDYLNKWRKPLLLLLDDLMLHVDKKWLDLLFTVKSHHQNIGVFFLTQNAFQKELKTARDNCQYLILMNSPSLIRQIRDIGTNLFPHKTKRFMEIYFKCTKEKYGYLIINLHAATNSIFRLYTDIFPPKYIRVFDI